MKKATIRIIILITGISLSGLIITQLLWINNAVKQSEKQFDHRITLALKDVINEIVPCSDSADIVNPGHCVGPYNTVPGTPCLIDGIVLDSLLKNNFEYHELDTVYSFSIERCFDDSVLYSSKGTFNEETSYSFHKMGLFGLWKDDCYNLKIFFPSKKKFILFGMASWMLISIIFITIIIFSFIYTIHTILKQKKLSEIKNDFINNMTHEFKTPISTISLASEILLKSDPVSSSERINKYSQVIFDENQRMRNQVERVLQIASLEKDEFRLNKVEINVHSEIKSNIKSLCLEQSKIPINIHYKLKAENCKINLDQEHFIDIINNLVDNACKYTNKPPDLTISSENTENGILLRFKDKGIGMNSETQKRIFEKFYRMPTGNLHDIKGFGLGLHYVKFIVEAHEGWIDVNSILSEGSTFTIFLPY